MCRAEQIARLLFHFLPLIFAGGILISALFTYPTMPLDPINPIAMEPFERFAFRHLRALPSIVLVDLRQNTADGNRKNQNEHTS